MAQHKVARLCPAPHHISLHCVALPPIVPVCRCQCLRWHYQCGARQDLSAPLCAHAGRLPGEYSSFTQAQQQAHPKQTWNDPNHAPAVHASSRHCTCAAAETVWDTSWHQCQRPRAIPAMPRAVPSMPQSHHPPVPARAPQVGNGSFGGGDGVIAGSPQDPTSLSSFGSGIDIKAPASLGDPNQARAWAMPTGAIG